MKESRERILAGAFQLFLENNYEKVSTAILEEKIGLSRGSIFYYSKSKQGLFRDVINKFILEKQDIRNRLVLSTVDDKSLLDFLNDYLDSVEENIASMRNLVADESKSSYNGYFRLVYQAQQYYDGFSEQLNESLENEIKVFEKVARNAVDRGEIKPDLDPDEVALHLRYILVGCSFLESLKAGVKPGELRSMILSYYQLIRYEYKASRKT